MLEASLTNTSLGKVGVCMVTKESVKNLSGGPMIDINDSVFAECEIGLPSKPGKVTRNCFMLSTTGLVIFTLADHPNLSTVCLELLILVRSFNAF